MIVLKKAEDFAKENKKAAFGLDMWNTVRGGNCWTFGVTYIDMNRLEWINIFEHYDRYDHYGSDKKTI